MNLDNDDILENETLDQEETQENEEPGETQENEEPGENLETITIDYSQDFIILENIGYFQLSLLGTLVLFFVMSLVIKFIKSFF